MSRCADVQWEKRIKTNRVRGGWSEWRVVVSGGGMSEERKKREAHEVEKRDRRRQTKTTDTPTHTRT